MLVKLDCLVYAFAGLRTVSRHRIEMAVKHCRGRTNVVKAGGAAAALKLVRQSVGFPKGLPRRGPVLARPVQMLAEKSDTLLDRNAVLLKKQIELFPHGRAFQAKWRPVYALAKIPNPLKTSATSKFYSAPDEDYIATFLLRGTPSAQCSRISDHRSQRQRYSRCLCGR